MGDSGEKNPIRFFRWFWDVLKEEKVFLSVYLLKSFMLICFSQCNLNFESVLICLDLHAKNITKMSHTQQWFYWSSTFHNWILLKLHYLHDKQKFFNQNNTSIILNNSYKIYCVKCPWFWLWLIFVPYATRAVLYSMGETLDICLPVWFPISNSALKSNSLKLLLNWTFIETL